MISENISIIDIDATHWNNLFALISGFIPGRGGKAGKKKARGRLFILHDHGKVLKAFHSEQGAITSELKEIDRDRLPEIAKQFDTTLVVLAEKGAARRMMHLVQSRLSLDQNFIEQGFEVYRSVRESFVAGDFASYPFIPLRDIGYSFVANLLKLAVPAGKSIILVVFDERTKDLSGLPIYTSLIARFNKNRELDLLTTTDSLAGKGLERIDDLEKEHKKILKLAEKNFGPVFLGIFTALPALKEMALVPPKDLLKTFPDLVKQGKLIIDPFPLRLKMAIKAEIFF